uniref:Transmembrane protein 50A n=1 Tax=Caligus clemensi TaxID=344056 RepID=C1C1K4_CALCM|nr:Transmembrane protein 50A [Caligus clemensi]
MSGLLSRIPISFDFENKRNVITSILSGFLFATGWWFAIDISVLYGGTSDYMPIFHICGAFSTISMIMLNMVTNDHLEGGDTVGGCCGSVGAKVWFFSGFVMAFGALIGAGWIFFGEYMLNSELNTFKPSTNYPGFGFFAQNFLIFIASLTYRFGRSASYESSFLY